MSPTQQPTGAKGNSARILAIDDDEGVLDYYRRMLSRAGFWIQGVSSAKEGLRCLKRQEFDLVILDLQMPEMDGMEFLRQIRGQKRRPEVLMVSGYASLDDAVEGGKLGLAGAMNKPVTAEVLLAKIGNLLTLHRDTVVAFIRRNFHTIRSREEVAAHLGVSPKTVSARVQACTGEAFRQFLDRCRIDEARHLLVGTDMDIHAIGVQVGYVLPQSFSRTFRRLTGLPPRVFRANHRIS